MFLICMLYQKFLNHDALLPPWPLRSCYFDLDFFLVHMSSPINSKHSSFLLFAVWNIFNSFSFFETPHPLKRYSSTQLTNNIFCDASLLYNKTCITQQYKINLPNFISQSHLPNITFYLVRCTSCFFYTIMVYKYTNVWIIRIYQIPFGITKAIEFIVNDFYYPNVRIIDTLLNDRNIVILCF